MYAYLLNKMELIFNFYLIRIQRPCLVIAFVSARVNLYLKQLKNKTNTLLHMFRKEDLHVILLFQLSYEFKMYFFNYFQLGFTALNHVA